MENGKLLIPVSHFFNSISPSISTEVWPLFLPTRNERKTKAWMKARSISNRAGSGSQAANSNERLTLPVLSCGRVPRSMMGGNRSEEHTSELQSLRHLVCRLLLEKNNSTRHRTFWNTGAVALISWGVLARHQ